MYYLRKIVMLLSASLVFGNTERGISQDSVAPLYINDFGQEMLCDVPWVVNKDEPIPFFFLIKDCDQYPLAEFHGLAIYDISNGGT